MLDITGLENRFGAAEIAALADWNGDGSADAAVIAQAIADASDHVSAACAGRYLLPFDPQPRLVAALAADIAYYRLHRLAAPEGVRRRYEEALRCLTDIAEGRLHLDADLLPAGA